MGISDQQHFAPKDWILDLNLDSVVLVLSETEMASAQIEAVAGGDFPILLTTLNADAEIPRDTLSCASILVLEIRIDMPASLERLSAIREYFPDLPVVAAVRNADVALVRALLRQGVRDVVSLPLAHPELLSTLSEIAEQLHTHAPVEIKQGQLISVLKSIGGVGSTTVATHLASTLAARSPARGVCIIDLDLQFGNAASYLGLSNELSAADLLAAGSRIDGELLRSVASTTPQGLHVIAAPADIMPVEAVNADQILRLIDLARAEYDYVVIDLPTNWTNWTLSLVARSTAIFLIAELSVGSLRQAKRQLQLLQHQNIVGDHIHVVANRVEKKLFRTIDLDAAGQALGHPVTLSIHNDYPLVRAAHDQGVLIQEIRAKSKILNDIENFLPHLGLKDGV